MDKRRIIFKEQILQLLDLSTTPEKALQLLSSPSLSPGSYSTNDNEPVVIYIVCIRYMAKKVSGACLESIWEDFIRMVFKYSINFSNTDDKIFQNFLQYGHFMFPAPELCRIFIPIEEGPVVSSWLDEVLSIPENCSNPYIRLKLFCLRSRFVLRRYDEIDDICSKKLSKTFIYTIYEIEPHRLYPNIDEYDIGFRGKDLSIIINQLTCFGELQYIISNLLKQFDERDEVTDNNHVTKFLCNFMQIIGTFAVIAGCNSDYKSKVLETKWCFSLFKRGIGNLVNCDNHILCMSPWEQFLHIINFSPFRQYTIEVIRDLTDTILKNRGDLVELMMSMRDLIMKDLEICSRTSELPRLLMSCQINGPAHLRRHSLLLKSLSKNQDNLRNNDNIDRTIGYLFNFEH